MVNKRVIILLLLALVIVALPLIMYNGTGNQSYFGGSDDQASAYLESQGYQSWFHSLWNPSPEMESLLFVVQASVGAIVVGYILGYYTGITKARRQNKTDEEVKNKKID